MDDGGGAVPFCWPECGLNLHQFEALCSAPPWRTDSPSTLQCASGSPGVAPPVSSSWSTSGGSLAHAAIFPGVNPQSRK